MSILYCEFEIQTQTEYFAKFMRNVGEFLPMWIIVDPNTLS